MRKISTLLLTAMLVALPTVSQAHEYRYRDYHNHYHGDYGRYRRAEGAAIGLGIAGAIIGLGIAAESSRRYRRDNCYYETVRDDT